MTQVDELLASARKALEAGNQLVARGYLRRAARLAPDRLDIWRDLLQVTEMPEDRRQCLEQIVALDPSDAQAAEALAQLRAEIAAAEEDAQDESLAADPQAQQRPEDTSAPVGYEPPAPVILDMRQDITDEMRRQWDEAVAAGKPLHCIDHPGRETALRCNRCGAPVCTDCIVRTPVGFRCKECIKAQQSAFYNARWLDYPVAALISLVLSVPAAVMAGLAGWWFAMIISPIAGGLIGGIVQWAIGRRHGRWIWLLVGACIVVGALAALSAMSLVRSPGLISIGIYAVMATGAAVGVLRMGGRR
jgi:hypothetical protein